MFQADLYLCHALCGGITRLSEMDAVDEREAAFAFDCHRAYSDALAEPAQFTLTVLGLAVQYKTYNIRIYSEAVLMLLPVKMGIFKQHS